MKGLRAEAATLCQALLETEAPLSVVERQIIPALDGVGVGFEKKTVYLPQLLMSAEAAKSAFEVIKASMPSERVSDGCDFVIATVKGDIHDIGKNIVKVILENYGFEVIDLGKDVDEETVLEAVIENDVKLCGLSALMTSTVPAMESTIKLLNEKAPHCKVVVGGAVLTQEYADMIGADKYCKDALAAVNAANEYFGS